MGSMWAGLTEKLHDSSMTVAKEHWETSKFPQVDIPDRKAPVSKATAEDEGTASGPLWPPTLDGHVGTLGIKSEK